MSARRVLGEGAGAVVCGGDPAEGGAAARGAWTHAQVEVAPW